MHVCNIYDYFSGVKQLVCDADYSPQSCVKVQNAWNFTSMPPMCLWCYGTKETLCLKHISHAVYRY